jgi:hypothetical protein
MRRVYVNAITDKNGPISIKESVRIGVFQVLRSPLAIIV